MIENTVSFWHKTAQKTNYQPLNSSIETDTLIIGAGITGITCAYCLADKGCQPVLIEAGGLCDGTTGNTTGKITIQHDTIYSTIYDKHGFDYAKTYAESQNSALQFVKDVVRKEAIDCQFAENTAFIYAADESGKEAIEKEYALAGRLGIDAELIKNADFPPDNVGLLAFRNQAVFHSVRYCEALAKAAVSKGAKIYGSTKAVKVEDHEPIEVTCENGAVIKANHLVMATQYPIYDGPNIFYTRLYPKRAYGIAVSAERDWPEGSYISAGGLPRSIRTHIEKDKKVLIVVGESHNTGRGEENMEQHFENLIQFAEQIAGIKELLAKWSAQDYNTPDHIPYIGRISEHSSIYAAAGYRKWGLSNGTLAGIMIADLITGGNCQYEELYSRKRGDILNSAGSVISETFGAVGELIKSKFEEPESIRDLARGEGREITFKGKRAGIYRDDEDNVIIVNISCEHMTTTLNFNDAEKTWDCPAHGGRFAVDGKLLEGPPKDSLKVLFRGKFSDLIVK